MNDAADVVSANEELPGVEEVTIERQHGCLTAIVVGAVLAVVTVLGGLWMQTALAGLIQQNLTVHTIAGAVYAAVLLIPFGLVVVLLRDRRFALWRGVALALALAGGYAAISDLVLAIDTGLVWPGLPMSVLPAVSILYGVFPLIVMRRKIGFVPPIWMAVLGMAFALLVSIPWGIVGVLGTGLETAIGVFEAIGSGLVASLIVVSVFYFDDAFLQDHPLWAAVIAGFTFWAIKSGVLTVRGYWLQTNLLSLGWIPAGFVGGALLVASTRDDDRSLKGWWALLAYLSVLFMLPFTLTEGFEGEWMPDQMGLSWGIGATAMLAAGIVLAIVCLSLVKVARQRDIRWWASAGVGMLAVVSFGAPYIAAGQPGVQPDSFFVVMVDQADTSFARDIEDRDERVTSVYDTLVDHADRTQADLRMFLDRQHATYTPYYLVNGIEVQGPRGLRRQIARRVDVARILDSPQTRPLPEFAQAEVVRTDPQLSIGENLMPNVAQIEADRVWDEFDVRGEGIIVGHADSGIDWTHPEIRDRYVGSASNHDYAWFDPWYGALEPTDGGSHGTYTLGIVLGKNGIGVAPDAQWIGCRNLARNLGDPAYYLDCMQFLFAPFPLGGDPLHDGDPLRGAHVTNNSWGCPPQEGCDGETLGIGVTNLRNAGQMMVVSAGNDGPECGTVSPPASADDAFSVGAVDFNGDIAGFSSRGPVEIDGSGRTKPDIVAPGVDIFSSSPGDYMTGSGTSSAGPHVTGVVALMWSANPALIGDVDTTEQIITETAHFIPAPNLCGGDSDGHNNVYGYGLIDAYAAVAQALDTQP